MKDLVNVLVALGLMAGTLFMVQYVRDPDSVCEPKEHDPKTLICTPLELEMNKEFLDKWFAPESGRRSVRSRR